MHTRPELEPLPRLMAHLAIDPDRGYPVPWFVEWRAGKPEFRAMDGRKYVQAVQRKLCWVCGNPLRTRFAFVVGPMCGINRTSSEPPSHIECGRWSARNCPFLSKPETVRREDDLVNNSKYRDSAPGFAIVRNPGVTLIWITREYELFDDGKGSPLIQMGRPQEIEFYREGRAATRAEVLESIENGIGAVEAMARQEEGGMEYLRKRRAAFEKMIPGEKP
jgi:hypothetical protein